MIGELLFLGFALESSHDVKLKIMHKFDWTKTVKKIRYGVH